jgi:hypothetical protein
VIGVLRELSVRNPASSWSFLVGDYDGVVGWLVFLWAATIAASYGLIARRKPAITPATPYQARR